MVLNSEAGRQDLGGPLRICGTEQSHRKHQHDTPKNSVRARRGIRRRLALGATLVNVCHVIAARDMVSPKMMAAWVEAFYAKLPQRSLSEALDYALKISRAPMRFYGRQVANVDLLFMQESARTSVHA